MRKLIASINITMDGFMAGPASELDWHFQYWTEEMAAYATRQLSQADTILLGRETYEAMAGYWPFITNSTCFARDDIPYAEMMNEKRKIVFSRKLKKLGWNNSVVADGKLRATVTNLKGSRGNNIILYGSRSILTELIRLKLVDEYVLWLHPLVLRAGLGFYSSFPGFTSLKLVESKSFSSGVVLLRYRSNGDPNHQINQDMETINLNEDIRVVYAQASSFPQGIMAAYEELHSKLPNLQGRTTYGISYPDKSGAIQYKAAATALNGREAAELGLEEFVIPKGTYIIETIDDWRKDVSAIGRTFQEMLRHPKIDRNGFCLEIYEGDAGVKCLVKLAD